MRCMPINNQHGELQDSFYTIPPPSLTRYQPVIRTVVFQPALIRLSEHVFFQAKYHQHQEILNKSQRWRSLYPHFAIRLLILLSLPSYIKPSKQLGLQWQIYCLESYQYGAFSSQYTKKTTSLTHGYSVRWSRSSRIELRRCGEKKATS